MTETRSTCPYCGVGCGVIIQAQAGQITGVRGDPDHPANFGRLCTKGSTLHLTAAPAYAQQIPLQDKPFAEHKIVLQLSDNDPRKQGLVLSVASNLMKHYDPDKVAIEIVAFGPGIDLLRPENPNRKMVESLVAQGARFDICLNTVDTLERESGKRERASHQANGVLKMSSKMVVTMASLGRS